MDFTIKNSSAAAIQDSACLVVGIFESYRLSGAAEAIDNAGKKYISNLLKDGDLLGQIGDTLLLRSVPKISAKRVLLVGCGKQPELTERQYREVITHSNKALQQANITEAVTYLPELNVKDRDHYWKIKQAVEISHQVFYQFNQLKKKKSVRKKLKKLSFSVSSQQNLSTARKAVKEGKAIIKGISLTRDLANLPPNICTPSYLAEQARELARQYELIKTLVLGEAAMGKLGMGSLLSVAQGSNQPAKLIIMRYQGGKKNAKPVVLIGKGVTFDSGGISLKPAAAMDEMKYDMCGAASVFGAIMAIAEMQLPINVVGVVPSVENMPGGKATRPGDIYTSMSGQTIEILNTDAEGRLILCDALTYSERYKPTAVIDIATLTGACVIALGKHASGLMSNHTPLAKDLLHAGEISADRAWQLPLWDEYQTQLRSNFADIANVGGRDAGTITAACFLSRFAKKFNWAHIDIAGTAWLSGDKKGATGRPVPMLAQYLVNQCRKT